MYLLSAFRFFAALVSILILAAAAYLLWSWYDGRLVYDAAGLAHRQRDAWRLGAGLVLALWSFLGRLIVLPLVARRDTRPSRPARSGGHIRDGITGASLYVEEHGPPGGAPLIFTHGWGMDSTFWSYARQDLADRFRLILWDLPGLGKSKAVPGGISLEAFAAELAGLAEAVGSQRPVLVGHSIGGMTIQTLLRDHPRLQRRLAGVVLLNTTYTNPLTTMVLGGLLRPLQRPLLEPASKLTIGLQPLVWLSKWQSYLSGMSHLAHRFGFGPQVTRSQLEHVTLLSTRASPAVEARGNLAMFHWDSGDVVKDAALPVLVVGGDRDIVTKLEASRRIAEEAESGTLRVVEDANHLSPMERADVYNRMIADFALQVQSSATADLPADRSAREEIRRGPFGNDPFPPQPR